MNRKQAGFSPAPAGQIDGATVRSWFEDPVAVRHYARAAVSIGLWRSEEIVFDRVFRPDQRLLDLGCGAGRIALGLGRRGYRRMIGIDFAPDMIAEAERLSEAFGSDAEFKVGEATSLPLADASCDGAIFGFNGLMQIPGRERRRAALREIFRVVRAGGMLVFTTHDRALASERRAWAAEAERWRARRQDPRLVEFGDRLILANPEGRIFMHLPDRSEVLEDLGAMGWQHLADHWRSELANESAAVREFSDECRFWVARRRAAGAPA